MSTEAPLSPTWLLCAALAMGFPSAGCGSNPNAQASGGNGGGKQGTGGIGGASVGSGGSDAGGAAGVGTGGAGVGAAAGAAGPWGLDVLPPNTTCVAPARPRSASRIDLVPGFPDIPVSQPMGLFQAPGDTTRFYLVQQEGVIQVFENIPGAVATSELLSEPVEVEEGVSHEGGLIGFAFHPDYTSNGTAFLAYTVRTPGVDGLVQRIARYKRNSSGLLAKDIDILEVPVPAESAREEHNLSAMVFGADGFLYVGMGDAYVLGDDPANPAQNPSSLFGKILRLDVGPTGPYRIPDGNPYKAGGGAPEVFALGFRNPWRFSFDRARPSDLWVADVGDDVWEEVNKVTVGKNYGWSGMEAGDCHVATSCDKTGRELPVAQYSHENGRLAIVGGYVYRGAKYPSLVGTYFYGDFAGRIMSLAQGSGAAAVELDTGLAISSFAEDNEGELYVLAYEGQNRPAQIFRIVAPAGGAATFPTKLSQTGCVNPEAPTEPAAGVLPFDVNSPLWSDGADKRRWLALPTGTKIHVREDGDFDLPVGAVLMKEFQVAGKRIETRLFVRHVDGEWAGYTYEWNDAGTDADLLASEKWKALPGATPERWFFPTRGQCLTCHTAEAGRSLGLELAQLNRSVTYPATGRTANQLLTLEHLGLLDRPLGDLALIPRLADPLGSEAAGARARSYLHANCSFCHRPGGTGRGFHNLLYSVTLPATNVCDVVPSHGDFGIENARLVAPGHPERSILLERMKVPRNNRMPPLASARVDVGGVAALDAWIRGLTACTP